jgi:ectoine hydroxylase
MALSAAQAAQFAEDGFVICKGMFDAEEVSVLSDVCRQQAPRDDKPYFWGIPADPSSRDIFNAVCFSERIVEAMSTLLQDEVTLFHRKLVMKDRESSTDAGWDAGNAWEVSACPRCPPARARAADDVAALALTPDRHPRARTLRSVQWHQDYGYWYSTELHPNMASCMVAVDRAHELNGALNVLRGSHKLGRLNHAREHTAGEVSQGQLSSGGVARQLVWRALGSIVCGTTECGRTVSEQDVARSEMCADRCGKRSFCAIIC